MKRNVIITRILLAVLFPLGMLAGYFVGNQATEQRQFQQDSQVKFAPYPDLHASVIADLVNSKRAEAGLQPLVYNTKLEATACQKAQDLIDRNYWAHQAPDGKQAWDLMSAAGYNYHRAGENLAYGQRTDQQVIDKWINSPTHEENITDNSFLEQGMCVKYGEFQGGRYAVIVNHFGSQQ